jgi:hypothetical protein
VLGFRSDTLVSGIRPKQRWNDMSATQNIAAANAQATEHQPRAQSQSFHLELQG